MNDQDLASNTVQENISVVSNQDTQIKTEQHDTPGIISLPSLNTVMTESNSAIIPKLEIDASKAEPEKVISIPEPLSGQEDLPLESGRAAESGDKDHAAAISGDQHRTEATLAAVHDAESTIDHLKLENAPAMQTTAEEDKMPGIETTQSNELSTEAIPQTTEAAPEVEYDSSPYESSTEESSSDDSDDSDDYEMLDPVEQARRLMEGGDSGDEGQKQGVGGQLRTANETIEEVVEIPNIEMTPATRIEELGNIETMIENMILIKAKTSGEYQVLDMGSVLCLEDRTVFGAVAETLGRVQEPLYCVRFTNAEVISGFGLEKGKTVFYVPEHSSFVFTQALRAYKGTDASNVHDEEVGGDEIEFSDDEAEAEYKKQKKMAKQERQGLHPGPTRGRGGYDNAVRHPQQSQMPATLSYDDTNMDNHLYQPLTRPSNLNTPWQAPPPPQFQQYGFVHGLGMAGQQYENFQGSPALPPHGYFQAGQEPPQQYGFPQGMLPPIHQQPGYTQGSGGFRGRGYFGRGHGARGRGGRGSGREGPNGQFGASNARV